jgi:hypothetical protein
MYRFRHLLGRSGELRELVQITVKIQQQFDHNIVIARLKYLIKAQPVALAQLGERQTEVISHYIWRYSVRSAEATQLLLRLINIGIMNISFLLFWRTCTCPQSLHNAYFLHSIGLMESSFAALRVLESLL